MTTVKDRLLFVNLPVEDLEKFSTFFKAPGYDFNVAYSGENARYMLIGT